MIGFPIMGEMYDECFPMYKLIWDKKTPHVSSSTFSNLVALIQGVQLTQVHKWVKESNFEYLDNNLRKSLPPLMENFEEGYSPNPDVDKEVYLAAFLAMLLSHWALVIL